MPTATPTPTPITPAAPNPSLNAIPGETTAQYEARLGATNNGTGTGFGTTTPAQPATDLSSAQDQVAKQLGFNSYQDALTTLNAPSPSETDLYNQAYSAAGLDALSTQITSRQNDLATATGNINDNPWLDEADRVGRTKTLTDLANADIKNLQDEYNTKLKSVQDLVANETKDAATTATANKTKLSLLESQAKELATQAAANTKTQNAPPKTIKGPSGATYQWNPNTQTFDMVLPGTPSGANPLNQVP